MTIYELPLWQESPSTQSSSPTICGENPRIILTKGRKIRRNNTRLHPSMQEVMLRAVPNLLHPPRENIRHRITIERFARFYFVTTLVDAVL